MAWNETGRPTILSCCRPAQSVQGMSSSTSDRNAASASSAAIRRIVDAGTPADFLGLFRREILAQEPVSDELERGHRLAPVREREFTDQRRCDVDPGRDGEPLAEFLS